MIAKPVEEAVGREVDIAFCIARRDPADRTRCHDRIEWVVPQAVAVLRLVKMQVFRAWGVHAVYPSIDCELVICPSARALQGRNRSSGRSTGRACRRIARSSA